MLFAVAIALLAGYFVAMLCASLAADCAIALSAVAFSTLTLALSAAVLAPVASDVAFVASFVAAEADEPAVTASLLQWHHYQPKRKKLHQIAHLMLWLKLNLPKN